MSEAKRIEAYCCCKLVKASSFKMSTYWILYGELVIVVLVVIIGLVGCLVNIQFFVIVNLVVNVVCLFEGIDLHIVIFSLCICCSIICYRVYPNYKRFF